MQIKSNFILPLSDATATIEQVSGKGASLRHLAAAGLPQARFWMLVFGSILYFPGMVFALWGRLTLGENYFISTGFGAQLFANQKLVTGGPFAIVGHPMYAGLILAACGSLLIYQTWTTLLLACFDPLLLFRTRCEEAALAVEFGEQWQEYCKRVPAFFPRFGKG